MSFEQVKKKFCEINNIPLETESFVGFNKHIDMKAFYHFIKNGLDNKQLLKIQEFIEQSLKSRINSEGLLNILERKMLEGIIKEVKEKFGVEK